MNDWGSMKDGELLLAYASLMEELRTCGIVRSSNNPVADFTEFFVARALGLTLDGKSAAGHDALDTTGVRYQIKGRRPTEHNKSVQLGIMCTGTNFHFRRSVLNDPRVTDITEKLAAAQQGAPADGLAAASLRQARG